MSNPTQTNPDFSKRYWLFAWDDEYPRASGGMSDFVASFDTIEEAQRRDNLKRFGTWGQAQIFDSHALKISHFLVGNYGAWGMYA